MSYKISNYVREHLSLALVGFFLVFALFNPWFKKYDYGAGWPVVLLFGVVLLAVAIFEFRKERERVVGEKLLLLIFLGAVGASFAFSDARNFGFSEVVAFFSAATLYLIFAYRKTKWVEDFLKLVLTLAVVAVVVGYGFYFFAEEVRMFGPFFNVQYHANVWPNAFALFLLMAWPVTIVLSQKKKHWQTALLIGLILSALLLTFSRGALIVLGGQLILLLGYFARRMKFRTVLWVLLSAIFAIALFMNANYAREQRHEVIDVSERVTFGNNEGLTSKQERVDFWLGAVELIKEKPLFGWGPYSFRTAYNVDQRVWLANADHPHNVFLKIGAENGLLALGAFVGFLVMVFYTVAKRFGKLSKQKRDQVYVMGVAVAGAFAHNLIDYNFNFMVNLVLLFMFIAMIRSIVVTRAKVRTTTLGMVLAIVLAGVVLWEGGMLALKKFEYSLYPRNFYLTNAEEALALNDFEGMNRALERQFALNPLDAQAHYLKGVYYCDEQNTMNDLGLCAQEMLKAVELNPKNSFIYYRDYFTVLERFESPAVLNNIAMQYKGDLEDYFEMVKLNVHFTAYTENVEVASQLADILTPYLAPSERADFLEKRDQMVETAQNLRSKKTF